MHNVGDGIAEFSVEVHHGGFFVGYGHLRSYVDEKVAWFDNVESDTWSPLWLDDFLEKLGYNSEPNAKFYWLLPEKTLADGLRIIAGDHDTNVMALVADKHKNLVVYVDHDDNIGGLSWDDIVTNPVVELPKVFSPMRADVLEKKQGEKLPVFYTNLEKGRVDQNMNFTSDGDGLSGIEDSDTEDEGFLDTDNEIDDGDDDLFEDNVEGHAKDNKKAKGSKLKALQCYRPAQVNDEDDTDEEELTLPDSDGEGEDRLRLKSFREEDMDNPSFSVGMVFASVEMLRKAITQYSVKNRVEIKMPRNDRIRVRAHCAEGCPWTLYASEDSRVKAFVVKTYYGVHKCQKEWQLSKCTSKWLAEKYLDVFRANEKMSITSFGKVVQKDRNLTPSRSKLARGRRLIRVAFGLARSKLARGRKIED